MVSLFFVARLRHLSCGCLSCLSGTPSRPAGSGLMSYKRRLFGFSGGGEQRVFTLVVFVDLPLHVVHDELDKQLIDRVFSLDLNRHRDEE